jgi:hypothetical protein
MRIQPLHAITDSVMHPLYLLAALSLLFVSPATTFPEPSNSSCGTTVEKVHKARKALVPYQRTMELAKARERKAYGELTICTGGGIFSVNKAVRCNEARWQAPERIEKVIDAEDQYFQRRKAFETLFEQARKECLLEP